MNEEHVYENKKYQSVVQSLKATFFDIVYQEENKLRSLQKSMEESSDNGEKEQLIGQISTHREKLDETMSLVDNLVHSIEELDLLTKNIVGFTSKEVVDKINDVKDENIKEAYQADLEIATKNQEQLQNSIMNEVVENPTFDSAKQEIEQGLNDVVNGNEDATIDTNSVVEIQAPSVEENVMIPEVQQEVVENDSFVPEVVDTVVETPEFVSEVGSSTVEPVAEVPVNDIVEEQPEINTEFVLSPIDGDVVAEASVNDGIDSINNQLSTIGDIQQDIENNPFLTETEKIEEIQRFKRITNGVIKAILVTKKQYEKLAASRDSQKALLQAKESIGDNPIAVNTIPAIDASIQNEQNQEQSFIDNGLLVSDKQKELENLMEQANILYKEGKAEEAQAIYDKVSEMNKAMQENNSEGVAIVKK